MIPLSALPPEVLERIPSLAEYPQPDGNKVQNVEQVREFPALLVKQYERYENQCEDKSREQARPQVFPGNISNGVMFVSQNDGEVENFTFRLNFDEDIERFHRVYLYVIQEIVFLVIAVVECVSCPKFFGY